MQHQAKKRFGQNFLVDQNIIQKIVHSINPQTDDCLIEIGPGLGALTAPLLAKVDQLHVIELDKDVIPTLLDTCQPVGKPVVHQVDVLKFDFTKFQQAHNDQSMIRVVGNLPYNISTPVLFLLHKHRAIIKDMHFMLQKEVIERIAARPGSRVYGRLSVMIQSYFRVYPLFTVSAQCFRPAPKVESAVIRLVPDASLSQGIEQHSEYEKLIQAAFSQRRKTLKNTLKKFCNSEDIIQAGIDPEIRAEQLSTADFIRLHQQITR